LVGAGAGQRCPDRYLYSTCAYCGGQSTGFHSIAGRVVSSKRVLLIPPSQAVFELESSNPKQHNTMNSFEEVDEGEPPVIDPYEVLELERTASADQIKSAYRKAALKNHPGAQSPSFSILAPVLLISPCPDKVPEEKRTESKEKFQSIAFAYAILSDPARRKRYDETGSTSESIIDSEGFNWSDYYREQFRDAISADAIKKFAKKYKGSDEEKDDILIAYEQSDGRMDAIYESVMLSDVLEDDARFRQIIDAAISAGGVPAFPAYTKESKKVRNARLAAARAEAGEAEEYAKELGVHDKLFGSGKKGKGKGKGGGTEDDLAALIRRNQQGRASFLDDLAAKYGANDKKGGKKGRKRADEAEDDEPSEEAFQAAAARLEKKRTAAKSETSAKRAKR
jgi:DnaJ homolog subfamily C member 9